MLEFVTTKTSDNILFHGLRTAGKKNDTVIVDIHGLSWDFYTTDFYRYFFDKINQHGVDFLAGDTRGANKIRSFLKKDGSEYQKGGAYEKFEDCLIDIKAWINKAEELGYKNIYLSGYSFGPTKISYYLTKTRDSRIKGLIFFSPSDIYGLVHEPSELPRYTKMLGEAKKLDTKGMGMTLLSDKLWGLEIFSAQTFLSLFNNPNTSIFNYFNPQQGYEVLNNITIPVLSFTGTLDDGIRYCKPIKEAVEILEANLKNSPYKKTIIFEKADHSFSGFENRLLEETVNFINEPERLK